MTIELQIDPKSGVPFYRQIIDQVKAAIVTGSIEPGDRLPTVRQLAVNLSVNPNTVSRAYTELELTGLVEIPDGFGDLCRPAAGRRRRDRASTTAGTTLPGLPVSSLESRIHP